METDQLADSSKRAVEATENIIEAYKLDMGIPLQSTMARGEVIADIPTRIHAGPKARRLSVFSQAPRGLKRKFAESEASHHQERNGGQVLNQSLASATERRANLHDVLSESARLLRSQETGVDVRRDEPFDLLQQQSHDAPETVNNTESGLQYCRISELVEYIINESFNVGGRPESVTQEDTSHGRILHAQYKHTDEITHTKIIKWEIGDDVPESILGKTDD